LVTFGSVISVYPFPFFSNIINGNVYTTPFISKGGRHLVLPIIKEINSILKFAKKAFNKGSFRLITQYVNGLITLSKKTVKKITEASTEIKNQSTLNYVLTEAKFEEEILKQRYLKKIKYLFKNAKIYLIIDDTLIERNGKTIEEAQKHFDHNSNSFINGHQFFTAI